MFLNHESLQKKIDFNSKYLPERAKADIAERYSTMNLIHNRGYHLTEQQRKIMLANRPINPRYNMLNSGPPSIIGAIQGLQTNIQHGQFPKPVLDSKFGRYQALLDIVYQQVILNKSFLNIALFDMSTNRYQMLKKGALINEDIAIKNIISNNEFFIFYVDPSNDKMLQQLKQLSLSSIQDNTVVNKYNLYAGIPETKSASYVPSKQELITGAENLTDKMYDVTQELKEYLDFMLSLDESSNIEEEQLKQESLIRIKAKEELLKLSEYMKSKRGSIIGHTISEIVDEKTEGKLNTTESIQLAILEGIKNIEKQLKEAKLTLSNIDYDKFVKNENKQSSDIQHKINSGLNKFGDTSNLEGMLRKRRPPPIIEGEGESEEKPKIIEKKPEFETFDKVREEKLREEMQQRKRLKLKEEGKTDEEIEELLKPKQKKTEEVQKVKYSISPMEEMQLTSVFKNAKAELVEFARISNLDDKDKEAMFKDANSRYNALKKEILNGNISFIEGIDHAKMFHEAVKQAIEIVKKKIEDKVFEEQKKSIKKDITEKFDYEAFVKKYKEKSEKLKKKSEEHKYDREKLEKINKEIEEREKLKKEIEEREKLKEEVEGEEIKIEDDDSLDNLIDKAKLNYTNDPKLDFAKKYQNYLDVQRKSFVTSFRDMFINKNKKSIYKNDPSVIEAKKILKRNKIFISKDPFLNITDDQIKTIVSIIFFRDDEFLKIIEEMKE